MMLLVSSYMSMVRATLSHYEGGKGVTRVTNTILRFSVWYALIIFPVAAAIVLAFGIATTLLGV